MSMSDGGKEGRALSAEHLRITMTWELALSSSAPARDPVRMLKRLPDGQLFLLDDYRWEGRPRRWISIGSDPDGDITVDEPTVSWLHCFLCRDRRTGRMLALDAESKNGVRLNRIVLHDGKAELQSGDVLQLGAAVMLACGRDGEAQQPLLMGTSLHEVLEDAERMHGTQRKAASALKMKQPTLSLWLATRKFDTDRA